MKGREDKPKMSKELGDKLYQKELYEKAKRHAIKCGYPELADDFAQEVAIEAFVSGCTTPKLSWLFTDLLRKEYGDARSISGRARIGATNPKYSRAIELDRPISDEGSNSDLKHTIVASPGGDPEPCCRLGGDRDLSQYGVSLNDKEHLVFELMQEGLSQAQISEVMGVDVSRVCQLAKVVKEKIAREKDFHELMDYYKADEDYSKLKVDWIEI